MKVSPEVIRVIKHHEGVKFKPYRCPALLWTVGVGHVIDPSHISVPIESRKALAIPEGWDRVLTPDEVDKLLTDDLRRFEQGVLRLCSTGLNQSRFDALVSLAFNVGLGNLQRSSIRMRHNRGDFEGAADAFLMWTKAGGRELPGLIKRRNDERAIYLNARYH